MARSAPGNLTSAMLPESAFSGAEHVVHSLSEIVGTEYLIPSGAGDLLRELK